VLELVPEISGYLYPVGRLDMDTSGLMILTNDGDLANLIMHPSHEIEKTYVAEVHGRISAASLNELAKGVELDDGLTAPAKVRLLSYSQDRDISKVEIIIHEGRKRQVRRMCGAIGHRVEKLTRTQLGNLDLKGLAEGEHRFMSNKEVTELKKLVVVES